LYDGFLDLAAGAEAAAEPPFRLLAEVEAGAAVEDDAMEKDREVTPEEAATWWRGRSLQLAFIRAH
jgi:NOL1/NOP2/fmu family ribosome biogenesis protein